MLISGRAPLGAGDGSSEVSAMVRLTVARRIALLGGGVAAAVLIAFATLAPSASAQTPTATPAPPKATATATPVATTPAATATAAPKATAAATTPAAATPAATGTAAKAAATPTVEATGNTTTYLLVGAVVILAIGAAVYMMRRRA